MCLDLVPCVWIAEVLLYVYLYAQVIVIAEHFFTVFFCSKTFSDFSGKRSHV